MLKDAGKICDRTPGTACCTAPLYLSVLQQMSDATEPVSQVDEQQQEQNDKDNIPPEENSASAAAASANEEISAPTDATLKQAPIETETNTQDIANAAAPSDSTPNEHSQTQEPAEEERTESLSDWLGGESSAAKPSEAVRNLCYLTMLFLPIALGADKTLILLHCRACF